MVRLKIHVARLLIVCAAALTLVYEPGLAVFAVGGAVAALMIVGDAGKFARTAAVSPRFGATDKTRS